MHSTVTTELEIKSSFEEMDRVVDFVDDFCVRESVNDAVRNKLHLIAEELVVNAVMHGYPGREDGWIALRLREMEKGIEITYLDEAAPFDPLSEAIDPDLDADLEEKRVGGLGIFLIREFAEDARYKRAGNRNTLSIVVCA